MAENLMINFGKTELQKELDETEKIIKTMKIRRINCSGDGGKKEEGRTWSKYENVTNLKMLYKKLQHIHDSLITMEDSIFSLDDQEKRKSLYADVDQLKNRYQENFQLFDSLISDYGRLKARSLESNSPASPDDNKLWDILAYLGSIVFLILLAVLVWYLISMLIEDDYNSSLVGVYHYEMAPM